MPEMPFEILRRYADISDTKIDADRSFRVAESGRTQGIPMVSDINAPDAPAVASVVVDFTIDENRRRMSTFSAFLPKTVAVSRKDRLKICTKTIVTRIAVKQEYGKVYAVGVYIQAANGSEQEYFARARREVILCAGAIATPQILLLRYALCLYSQRSGPKSLSHQHRV